MTPGPPTGPYAPRRAQGPGGWRALLAVAVAVMVVVADQLTKTWALHHLADGRVIHVLGPTNLVLTFNRGAAFSLGSGLGPLIEVVAIAVLVGVLYGSRRLARGRIGPALAVGLGLVSGGAVSNLVDRAVRHHHGGVVDFVQLVGWWPVFNVADASITVGALIVAARLALSSPPKSPGAGAPEGQEG